MISNKAKRLSSAGHINQSFKAGTEGQQRFYDSCRALNKDIKKSKKIKPTDVFNVKGEISKTKKYKGSK